MAKDDYHVIVCYILSYLYGCLKRGEKPSRDYLSLSRYPGMIPESYRNYIYIELAKSRFLTGIIWGDVPVLGSGTETILKSFDKAQITPNGIEYLQNDKTIEKAWNAIQSVGGLLFSAISAFR